MSRYLAFDTIERSNLKDHEKSSLRKWWDEFKPTFGQDSREIDRPKSAGKVAVHVLRSGAEGLATGAALGLAHANLPNGLDIPVPALGLNIPADGALALVSAVGAIGAGAYGDPDGIAQELNNAQTAGWSVLGFRKMLDISAEIKARSGKTNTGTVGQVKTGATSPAVAAHGESSDGKDRIVEAAKKYLKRK